MMPQPWLLTGQRFLLVRLLTFKNLVMISMSLWSSPCPKDSPKAWKRDFPLRCLPKTKIADASLHKEHNITDKIRKYFTVFFKGSPFKFRKSGLRMLTKSHPSVYSYILWNFSVCSSEQEIPQRHSWVQIWHVISRVVLPSKTQQRGCRDSSNPTIVFHSCWSSGKVWFLGPQPALPKWWISGKRWATSWGWGRCVWQEPHKPHHVDFN